ncbi:MAG TPA: ABC transporter permease [Verrucomicrobiae bacterium]
MTWLRLTLNDWRLRPLRMAVTTAGVAIAVAACCSLFALNRGYQEGIRLELNRLGAHVLLTPKGCPYDAASMALHGATWPCYLKQEYLAEARSVPGLAVAAPVFMTAVYESNATAIVYLGVDTNILALKTGWHITGSFPSTDDELLVGADVSKRRGWRVGTRVSLPGLSGQSATVTGVLAPTHSTEDSFLYLRLADAQQRFHHPGELTHVLVRLSDPNQMDRVVAELRGCDAGLAMNVVPLAHVFRTIQGVVNSTQLLLGSIAVVALLIAGTGVSNSILMSVTERTKEIGVMRALGASRADIFRIIWVETLQVCIAGAVVGIVGAVLSTPAIETWARSKLPFVPADALVRWHWQAPALSVALALIAGSVAAFLPAWRAARLAPVLAIRSREN